MRCVTTPSYTIKVNGKGYGYFQGERGLRQGDPMSLLLFVLVMDYLTRGLSKMSELLDFHFHPMCKAYKLTHLIFADDLMLFCKEKVASINRMMEVLNHFSAVSGLLANLDKSNIFLAEMDEDHKQEILNCTGFSLGSLPIRNLGLPLFSKKWSIVECHALVDKITQCVVKRIDRICRDYLWGNSIGERKVATKNDENMSQWYNRGVYQLNASGLYSVSSSYIALKGNMTRLREAELIWNDVMLPRSLQWIKNRHWRQFRKEVAATIIGALIYYTWQARNWKHLRKITRGSDQSGLEQLDALSL
uniref:Reverse transcriptase domain-containing protein n=1 Tax=Nicotiana tabacum TaxID=4097 RepID=A0A1S4BIX2_TOBAC|nr:PREDICTED: uncharacterized protein LOC107808781 [Nicotiana tabacum]